MTSNCRSLLRPWLLLVPTVWVTSAVGATTENVALELKAMAAQYGFEVKGMENTEEARGRLAGDDLVQRLSNLLSTFDYVLVRKPSGGIERVIVLGKKTPPAERSLVILLDSKRQGSQHLLRVRLRGPGPAPMETWVLLDTGADYVVLPFSLMEELGFSPDTLRDTQVQTANGKIEAKLGHLTSIELGMAKEENIAVAFIEDERLGSSGLLGMSVLGRYKVTIDDTANQIRLEPKL